jgi:amidase
LERRRLRVAVMTQRWDGGPVAEECVAAVDAVARLLEQQGHRVEAATPQIDIEAFDDANFAIWCAFLADAAHGAAQALGVGLTRDTLEATTLACVQHGAALTAMDMFAADRVINTVTRTMATFQEDHDILLTPTLAVPTWPIGHLNADDSLLDARGWYDKIFDAAPFTALFNATGQPAISLPLAMSEQGWPIGVQAVARYADEATLLSLAGDLEEELPWSHLRPRLMVSSSDGPEQSSRRTLDLTAKPVPPAVEARPREDHAASAAWKV